MLQGSLAPKFKLYCIAWSQGCRFMLRIGGNNLQFYPYFAPFSTLRGDEARPLSFSRESNMTHVQHAFEQIKWGQKKGLHRNLKSFCPQNQVKTKKTEEKKHQRSSSAQMQTIVKLLGEMQSNYWGDIFPPIPPRVSAPLHKAIQTKIIPLQQNLLQFNNDLEP